SSFPRVTRMWQRIDGQFAACDSVPISDRGFRYGMSLFETIRLKNGAPILLHQHLAKLMDACSQRDFHFEKAALEQVAKVLQTSSSDGVARIYVTAGDGSVTSAFDCCRVFI